MPRNRASQHATPNGNDRETTPVDPDSEKERLWNEKAKAKADAEKWLADFNAAWEAAQEMEKSRAPELVPLAAYLAARMQMVSTAMLQRRLRIPFTQANLVLDLLEEKGVVGPKEESRPREVLMTIDDLTASGIISKEAQQILEAIGFNRPFQI